MKQILSALILASMFNVTACGVTKTSTNSVIKEAESEKPLPFRLARRTYTRHIQSNGTPTGNTFIHSINFVDDFNVIDNGASAFGNPPETLAWRLNGHKVELLNRSTHLSQIYTVSDDGLTLTSQDGLRIFSVDKSTLPQNKSEEVLELIEGQERFNSALGNGAISFEKVVLNEQTDEALVKEFEILTGERPGCEFVVKSSPKTDLSYFPARILELELEGSGERTPNLELKENLAKLDLSKAISREFNHNDDSDESCPLYSFSLLTKDGYKLTFTFGFDD